jgi:hypothetical protein
MRENRKLYFVAFKDVLMDSHDAGEGVLAVGTLIASAGCVVVLFLHVSAKVSRLGEPLKSYNKNALAFTFYLPHD